MRRELLLLSIVLVLAVTQATAQPTTLGQAFPLMRESPLAHALLTTLPSDTVLRSGATTLTRRDIDAELAKMSPRVRPKFASARLVLLERLAVKALLTKEAAAWARRQGAKAPADPATALQPYLQSVMRTAEVSDAEVRRFYSQNRSTIGDATLEDVKPQVRQYLLDQKRKDAVFRHVNSVSRRSKVQLDRAWVEAEYRQLINNPVDRARRSGRPSLVDFGADGCAACDMMAPILKSLRRQYEGKANVLFVDVRDEHALAARFGIDSIPVQVFFDGTGREVFRHVGAFPEKEIKAELAKLGVKQ